MQKLCFVFGVVLALGACSKDKVDGVIDGLDGWADKMCACADKACADKVHEDYKKWEDEVLEPAMKGKKKEDISKEAMERGDAADKKRKDCRRKHNEPATP